MGMMTGLLHGIDNPVPVPGCLQGNFAAGRQAAQIAAIEFAIMIDANRSGSLSVPIDGNEDGEVLVSVAPDNWLHGASYVRSAYPAPGPRALS